MNDSENPFANAPQTHTADKRVWMAWGVAVVATMTALLFLMIWTQSKTSHLQETEALQKQLETSKADLSQALAENQTNQDLITSLKNQVADLEKEKEQSGQMAKNLESELRADLESKDVAISNLQGKLTVTILDRILFDSGEATLKPDGAAVIQKIATILTSHPQLKIQIVGHTVNVPIRPAAQSRYSSNWELSTARALAAVHYLTEKAGVDPRRLGAAGYGEFRPIADNATAEGRAKNRRIAITILPDELAVAETVTPPKPATAQTDPVAPGP